MSNQKLPLLYASMAGGIAVTGLTLINQYMGEEEDGDYDDCKTKEEVIEDLKAELVTELRTKFKNHQVPVDKDGWFTEDFMVQMHTLLYKYTQGGKDLLAECNFRERVNIMSEAEEAKENGQGPNDQIALKEYTEKMKVYDQILKGETKGVEEFKMIVQEIVFDYFNLILKEYYLNIDKCQAIPAYVERIAIAYKAIGEEMEKELLEKEIPEGLDKKMAEQLLAEKEALLTKIYTQLNQTQSQGQFDLEQTVLLNKTMFEDKMYLKTGYSGKNLQCAIHKFGIYKERMEEAKKLQDSQNDKIMKAFENMKKKKAEGEAANKSSIKV